jgi:hypothetical protein
MGRRRKPYDPSKRNDHNGHNGLMNGHGRTHDRRAFYRLPPDANLASVEILDPNGVPADAEARLAPGLHRDGTQAAGELEWHAPEAPRLVVVRSLRGDHIARMVARHQILQSQFEAGRHYQSLHEIAFARALHSLDLAAPVIDKNRYGVEPFSDQQRSAIRRLRMIDGTLALRLGVDVLELMQAVLLGGRSVAGASRQGGRKASYWCTAFRLALDEIAAIAGIATAKPKRPPVPEGCALKTAALVATVRNQR